MSINICKECGKEFEATSKRVLYCSADHYRPCPVCGKPVLAKYLSDPAKRCDECRGKKMLPKSKVERVSTAAEEKGNVYKGHPILGFVAGHEYKLDIKWDGWSAYVVTATYDITDEKKVNLEMRLSSKKSIESYFVM